VFGVSHHAVWVRLGQLGFTLKKTVHPTSLYLEWCKDRSLRMKKFSS
jgi:hypothetical protein